MWPKISLNYSPNFNTIKADQKIRLRLPSYPSDLIWSDINNIDNLIETTCDVPIAEIELENDKTLVFKAISDLSADCDIHFSNDLKVEIPDSQIISDNLVFSVRNISEPNIASVNLADLNNNCFWVAEPKVESVDDQFFYIQPSIADSDPIAYPIRDIFIKDDEFNPVFNTLIDSIFISIPNNSATWNTLDNYLIQYGESSDIGAISNTVSYSDPMTLQIDITSDLNDSLFFTGLSIIPSNTSESFSENLEISFFNNGQFTSFLDPKDFYIGEIDFYSKPTVDGVGNVILQGDNQGVDTLQSIIIKEKSLTSKLNNFSVVLPQELSIEFVDNQDLSFSSNNQGILNDLDTDTHKPSIENGNSTINFSFGSNTWQQGDSLIIGNIQYINNSMISSGEVPPAYIELDVNAGVPIYDGNPSFLTSIDIESVQQDKIIFQDSIDNFSLNDVIISNDNNPLFDGYNLNLMDVGSNLSIILPNDIDIEWSDNLYDFIEIYDNSGFLQNDIFQFTGLSNGNKSLDFTVISSLEDNIYKIKNLLIDINEDDFSTNLKVKNNDLNKLIGYNFSSIDCGNPSLSFDSDLMIWINHDHERLLPDIDIDESNIKILKNGFSINVPDQNLIHFNSENSDTIRVYSSELDDITNDVQLVLSDNNLQLTLLENINSLSYPIKIKNIPFKIKDFVYSNEPEFFSSINSQQINLSFKDFNDDNYTSIINEINMLPSLFFDSPRLYSIDNQTYLSFHVKDNFFDSNIDFSNLYLNIDSIDLINSSEQSGLNSFANNYIGNVGFNNGKTYEDISLYSFNVSNDMLNLINIKYDQLAINNSNNYLNLKINNDWSPISFKLLSPDCISLGGSRHFNPLIEAPIWENVCDDYNDYSVNIENPESGQSDTYNSFFEYPSGLYFLTFQYNDLDTSSVIIKKPIYIDTEPPYIYQEIYNQNLSFDPLPGSNSYGNGHDITLNDEINFSVTDGPNYF